LAKEKKHIFLEFIVVIALSKLIRGSNGITSAHGKSSLKWDLK